MCAGNLGWRLRAVKGNSRVKVRLCIIRVWSQRLGGIYVLYIRRYCADTRSNCFTILSAVLNIFIAIDVYV